MKTCDLAKSCGVAVQTVNRWKRGLQLPYLSYLVKIADTLNCSVDFLVGRSNKHYCHFLGLLKKHKITRYKLMKLTSIKYSHLINWKNGSSPQVTTLIELASFLNISLDQLIGRET